MNHLERALRSLDGLSIGDGFGQALLDVDPEHYLRREEPPGPWPWSDHTQMAMAVVDVLRDHLGVNQNALAAQLVAGYARAPHRGYATDTDKILSHLLGVDPNWERASTALFDGVGSEENRAATRAAPIGAWFANHPSRAADEARLAAVVTHAHPEAVAGAIAVAAATATRFGADAPTGGAFIAEVARYVPRGRVYDRLERAADVPPEELGEAARRLGQGEAQTTWDTVPFAIWIVASFGGSFYEAMWMAASVMSERDTVCALVGGILGGAGVAVPDGWRASREPLPGGYTIADAHRG